ncbi:MAG: hypothetical protein ACREIC_24295, partial [Limisphaerales bacterium]
RTPNLYRGNLRERTFETAFLEYGAMQNLVRSTGRRVWYLNDPVEDNPDHDWNDYRRNWESTLTASLLQPEVWRYEVAPWPERVFAGRYPSGLPRDQRQPIPPAYATELQVVINALNDMNQSKASWDCGTGGLGVLVSDSLMFERGEPNGSDAHLSQFYGLALPLVKRGMPVTPVQLENLTVPDYLKGFEVLLLSYHGQKPLTPEVHTALADWVKGGGTLLVVDDDADPHNRVREWWNSEGRTYATPRQHLFEQLGIKDTAFDSAKPGAVVRVSRGRAYWWRTNPAALARSAEGDQQLAALLRTAVTATGLPWREANHLLLRRGPYVIGAGLDESVSDEPTVLHGHFVNLFDSQLRVRSEVSLAPASRCFLLDLDAVHPQEPVVLASACKALRGPGKGSDLHLTVEGVANTPGLLLLGGVHAAPK